MAEDTRKLKRIQVPVNPEAWEVLDRLSALTGRGRSFFIQQMINENIPTFIAVADAIELSNSGQQSAAEKVLVENLGSTLLRFGDKS